MSRQTKQNACSTISRRHHYCHRSRHHAAGGRVAREEQAVPDDTVSPRGTQAQEPCSQLPASLHPPPDDRQVRALLPTPRLPEASRRWTARSSTSKLHAWQLVQAHKWHHCEIMGMVLLRTGNERITDRSPAGVEAQRHWAGVWKQNHCGRHAGLCRSVLTTLTLGLARIDSM